jgi:hypothetical protein
MARLVNDKQERFAQLMAMGGVTCLQAYLEAGYENGSSAEANSRKLKCKRKVRARIEELSATAEEMVQLYRIMLTELYVSIIKTDRLGIYDEKSRLRPIGDLRPEHRALIEGIDTTLNSYGEIKNVILPKRLDAAAQLARLHGLDKPTKIAPTNPEGDGPMELYSDADRAKALAAFLDRTKGKREAA